MQYSRAFISEHEVPRARRPVFQHLVDTYASETNKVGAVWSALRRSARFPATYGPTADVTWWGAEPTETLDAVRRAQR